MLILQAIIDSYIATEIPVGSKTLSMFPEISASSATIRNEMAILEAQKLISKTHTSSGRVPAELGYRYYFNHVLPKYGGLIDNGLNDEEQATVKNIFAAPYLELADIIIKSAEAMAELTQYVAITVGPQIESHRLAGFRLVPVTDNKVMAILVTDQGIVKNQVFVLQNMIQDEALDKLARIVNKELIGLPLPIVSQRLQTDFNKYLDESIQELIHQGSLIDRLLDKMEADRLNIRGQQHLMHYFSQIDEFEQIDRLNLLLHDPKQIAALIRTTNPGIDIKIGKELNSSRLENMSLMVTSIGEAHANNQITFAILGPENMSYVRMAQVFQNIRGEMLKYIAEYYK